MNIHHIALQASDLEASEKFYRDVLQLPLLEYQYDAAGKVRSVWLSLGNSILMLEKVDVKDSKSSFNVLAFGIKPHEREPWRQKLLAAKIKLTHESRYSIYFHDPAGNPLALSHHPH